MSPVSEGGFPTGSELMLWRPGLDHGRLRWRVARASLLSVSAVYVAIGVCMVVLGIGRNGVFSWVSIIVGASAIVAGVVCVVVDYRWFEIDHCHGDGRLCFLERHPGEYFYRPSDFDDLPPSMVYAVAKIMAGVRDVHASPAAAWLSPRDLREVHRMSWDALCVLDRTRMLRHALDNAVDTAAPDDLVQAAGEHVAAVDGTVDSVLTCLHQAVLLVTAWERKLAESELVTRLRVELGSTVPMPMSATLRAAESVPQSIFSYIAAARELLGAGPFDWELSASPPQVQRCAVAPSTLAAPASGAPQPQARPIGHRVADPCRGAVAHARTKEAGREHTTGNTAS